MGIVTLNGSMPLGSLAHRSKFDEILFGSPASLEIVWRFTFLFEMYKTFGDPLLIKL